MFVVYAAVGVWSPVHTQVWRPEVDTVFLYFETGSLTDIELTVQAKWDLPSAPILIAVPSLEVDARDSHSSPGICDTGLLPVKLSPCPILSLSIKTL